MTRRSSSSALSRKSDGVDALAADRVLARALVDELDVVGEVELHVARAGADRLGDELALDGQRVLEQLLVGVVEAIGDALLVEGGGQEPRGGGQRDLERVVGDRAQAIGVAHERAVDLAQAPADARHAVVEDLVAGGVAEAHRHRAGLDALDRVVEGVGEGRARELAVGDDVEAEVDLARRPPRGPRRRRSRPARRRRRRAPRAGAAGAAGCRRPRRERAGAARSHADLLRKPDSSATGRRVEYRYRPLRARGCLAAAGGRAPSRPPGRERDDLRRAARRGRRDGAPAGRPRRARRRPRGDRAGPGRGLLHRAARDPAPGGGRRPGRPAPGRARARARGARARPRSSTGRDRHPGLRGAPARPPRPRRARDRRAHLGHERDAQGGRAHLRQLAVERAGLGGRAGPGSRPSAGCARCRSRTSAACRS